MRIDSVVGFLGSIEPSNGVPLEGKLDVVDNDAMDG